MALLRPRLVLALGIHPIHFIGHYAPGTNWVNGTFQAIDCARESVMEFTVADQHTRAVALLHPCLRHANLRIRRPCLGNVPDPEVEIIRRYTSRNAQAIDTAACHS